MDVSCGAPSPGGASTSRLQIVARDHAEQRPVRVDDRIQPLTASMRVAVQRVRERLERCVRRQRRDGRAHHLAHEENLERIDRVFAAQVKAAPRDLLGQDRSPQHQHREAVRDRDGDQQRQQHVDVVRQLEREDDRR